MRPLFFFLLIALAACNNPATDEKKPLSVADSLQQLVIEGHDVAMAKMFKMQRQQKDLQARIDSLKVLPSGVVVKNKIARLETVLIDLKNVDALMQQWMVGFKYDTLKEDQQARAQYLSDQLTSVSKMKEEVLQSVAQADTVLAR